MDSDTKHMSAEALLNTLGKEGLIQQDVRATLDEFIVSRRTEKELGLYLRIIVGIGAFIASLFFIGFLTKVKLVDMHSKNGLIAWGVAFVVSALAISKIGRHDGREAFHTFLVQLSFCAMGIGKVLFIAGVAGHFRTNQGWGITIATSVITLATYFVYRMSIDRFLSTFAIFFSLLVNIVSDSRWPSLCLNLYVAALLLVVGYLFTNGKVRRDFIPLAYALTASLCAVVLFLSATSDFRALQRGVSISISLWYVNAMLAVATIAAIGWAAGGIRSLKREPLMLASLATLFLGTISAPGILLTICLAIMGYARRERLLLVASGLLMPTFLTLYYHNLDLTLLTKSGILVGSGILLLLGWAYVTRRLLEQTAALTVSIGPDFSSAPLVIATILLCGVFNYSVLEKERLYANGEMVLLQLAPVDPRSLMQGDYMRLRYALEQNRPASGERRGYMVVTVDENHVAKFKRFESGEPLSSDEKLIRYHSQYGNAKIVPDSFMFQEGHSQIYSQAKYGIFKFDGHGNHILTGLADARFHDLRPPQT